MDDGSNLTTKQLLFCKEYLKDFNATRAARDAGYSERSAKEIGTENLTKPAIRDYVEKYKKERIEKVDITLDFYLKELVEALQSAKENDDRTNHRGLLQQVAKYVGAENINLNVGGQADNPLKIENIYSEIVGLDAGLPED